MGKSVRSPLERDLPAEISLKDFLGTSEERREALWIFTTYADVFTSDKSSLGRTTVMQHQIPTCDGIPVNQRHRHIVPNQLVVKEHLQVESEQLCLARCVRTCVDYQQLNAKVKRDAFPLTRIEESLDVLGGVRLFFTIDLASAHNQVEVAPEDRHKTAFSAPFGLCEYNRMPFGLRGMPRMFQRIMLTIFCDELLEILIVYLDDIIVFSQDVSTHLKCLEMVFQKLREHRLKI